MVQRANLASNRTLTNYTRLLSSRRANFIADMALPVARVAGRTGRFYNIAGGFGFNIDVDDMERVSMGEFGRINIDVSQVSAYNLKEFGREAPVDDKDREAAGDDGLDLFKAATELSWVNTMTGRELRMATLLFNVTTFAGFTAALAGTAQWDDDASDPRVQADIAADSILKNTGVPLEECDLIVGIEPWRRLRRNKGLADVLQYTRSSAIRLSREEVAEALGCKSVIVGSAVYNTANENATTSNSYIWGKFALFRHAVPNPTPMAPHGLGATFSNKAVNPTGKVETYREEPRREIVLTSFDEDPIVTTASAGYLFSDVIS